MLFYQYDKTFEGLLTAVFEAFNRKCFPDKLISVFTEIPLFTEIFPVTTDTEKANRVLAGLHKKLSKSAVHMLFVCSLSDAEETDTLLFNYIRKTFLSEKSIELNFADPDVLQLSKMYKKVQQEAERMRQFVRFQKTADDIFFAAFEPIHNVLPLVIDFFEDRFADQQWLIYDVKHKYGLFYDLHKAEFVTFNELNISLDNGQLPSELMNKEELDFQQLWRLYFKTATIKERINPKLQRQHMPKRYWKYLTEKKQTNSYNKNQT